MSGIGKIFICGANVPIRQLLNKGIPKEKRARMTIGEIGFVIQKDDGTFELNSRRRKVGSSWSKRVVKTPGVPWKSWAGASKANVKMVRIEVDGKKKRVAQTIGQVMAVKLMVL